jgi:hypothetical protein
VTPSEELITEALGNVYLRRLYNAVCSPYRLAEWFWIMNLDSCESNSSGDKF